MCAVGAWPCADATLQRMEPDETGERGEPDAALLEALDVLGGAEAVGAAFEEVAAHAGEAGVADEAALAAAGEIAWTAVPPQRGPA